MDRLQLREASVTGDPPFPLGTQLPGNVVLERLIDEAGRVVVYEAKRLTDGEKIAVKTLKAQLSAPERDSLLLAIRSSASIRGNHVLRILDAGIGPGGRLYWTTEFADQHSMRALLDRGALGTKEAVKVLAQVCAALEEAHFLGRPHGDVRLEKILLGRKDGGKPTIKVSDVGFAAELAAAAGANIFPTTSPERLSGNLDRRCDVYSIGACAYELVANRPLFIAASRDLLARKIVSEQPNPLSLVAPATPPDLMGVIARAVAKNPLERFDTCRDLERALRQTIGAVEGPSVIWDAPVPVLRAEDLPRPKPKNAAPLWILAVGVVIGIAAALITVRSLGQKEGTREPPSSSTPAAAPSYAPVVAPSVNTASGVVRSILKPETPKRAPTRIE